MKLANFLKLNRKEIAKIVRGRKKPECVGIMLDGTRRMLKLEPGYHDDSWLYYKDYISNLIYKSIETCDWFFDMGIKVVVGPLASLGNLGRKNFMPEGLQRLLDPLVKNFPTSVYKKHNTAVSFYGDLDSARSMRGGKMINRYLEYFKRVNPKKPDTHIVIGIGFSTDNETRIIAHEAIEYYIKKGEKPSFKQLVKKYFGCDLPPIDIFIRTNEVRASGGLTPLLTGHDTQFYFPVSPGVISFSENMIRRVLYDYLFSRIISHGMHEHSPITDKEAKLLKKFYFDSKNTVLGIGRRIGDIWIHKVELPS